MRQNKLTPMLLVSMAGCLSTGEADIPDHVASVQQNVIARTYGSYCQEDYQNSWQTVNSGGWTTCANFNSAMNANATQSFYWNLHGVQSRFEETGDAIAGAGADTVDALWLYTHGGGWASEAVYAMWDQNSLASSARMRLGDDSRGLSLFIFHGCETLKNDAAMSTRWTAALRGGLRMVVGSHDQVFAGTNNTGDGQRFANNLQNGQQIEAAWKNALSGTSVDNDVAVLTAGNTTTDCWNRHTMTWANMTNFARVMDASVQWLCLNHWDNL